VGCKDQKRPEEKTAEGPKGPIFGAKVSWTPFLLMKKKKWYRRVNSSLDGEKKGCRKHSQKEHDPVRGD